VVLGEALVGPVTGRPDQPVTAAMAKAECWAARAAGHSGETPEWRLQAICAEFDTAYCAACRTPTAPTSTSRRSPVPTAPPTLVPRARPSLSSPECAQRTDNSLNTVTAAPRLGGEFTLIDRRGPSAP
jgi:hypothetical protein